MGCIEIIRYGKEDRKAGEINRNMGCIEINDRRFQTFKEKGLIETWDVLKCGDVGQQVMQAGEINRNMGCIEIGRLAAIGTNKHRLIETWDVLKLQCGRSLNIKTE